MSGQLLEEAYKTTNGNNPAQYLGYSSNNIYHTFPPLMADGREVGTTYQPESQINNELIKTQNIKSNWEYRKYLTENAVSIMKQNFNIAKP